MLCIFFSWKRVNLLKIQTHCLEGLEVCLHFYKRPRQAKLASQTHQRGPTPYQPLPDLTLKMPPPSHTTLTPNAIKITPTQGLLQKNGNERRQTTTKNTFFFLYHRLHRVKKKIYLAFWGWAISESLIHLSISVEFSHMH